MGIKSQMAKLERSVAIQEPESELDLLKRYHYQSETQLLDHDKRIVLTPRQEERDKRLRETWELLTQKSAQAVIKDLMDKYGFSHQRGSVIVREAQELWGNVKQMKKESQRALRIAQREDIIDQIRDDKKLSASEKYELTHRYLERIEKMLGLEREDTLSMDEVLDKLKLPEVIRTTDPEALKIDE